MSSRNLWPSVLILCISHRITSAFPPTDSRLNAAYTDINGTTFCILARCQPYCSPHNTNISRSLRIYRIYINVIMDSSLYPSLDRTRPQRKATTDRHLPFHFALPHSLQIHIKWHWDHYYHIMRYVLQFTPTLARRSALTSLIASHRLHLPQHPAALFGRKWHE